MSKCSFCQFALTDGNEEVHETDEKKPTEQVKRSDPVYLSIDRNTKLFICNDCLFNLFPYPRCCHQSVGKEGGKRCKNEVAYVSNVANVGDGTSSSSSGGPIVNICSSCPHDQRIYCQDHAVKKCPGGDNFAGCQASFCPSCYEKHTCGCGQSRCYPPEIDYFGDVVKCYTCGQNVCNSSTFYTPSGGQICVADKPIDLCCDCIDKNSQKPFELGQHTTKHTTCDDCKLDVCPDAKKFECDSCFKLVHCVKKHLVKNKCEQCPDVEANICHSCSATAAATLVLVPVNTSDAKVETKSSSSAAPVIIRAFTNKDLIHHQHRRGCNRCENNYVCENHLNETCGWCNRKAHKLTKIDIPRECSECQSISYNLCCTCINNPARRTIKCRSSIGCEINGCGRKICQKHSQAIPQEKERRRCTLHRGVHRTASA